MRRIATPDEIFDILDDSKGRKFATIGYVTGAKLNMPTVRKINPETNRMKNFDDYEALGKKLGYEGEIGGIVKLTSYTIQLSNRKQVGKDYADYKDKVNDLRKEYGLDPMKDKEGYTMTLNYGINGISAYGGNNQEKQGHVYYPANTYGVHPKSTYYVLDKDGSIDKEVSKEELNDLLKTTKISVSGENELRKMGVEDEKIKEYVEKIQSLGMAYKNFEYSSILYIVGSANGEKYIYINTNLNRAIGNVNVDPKEFAVIVKARYSDDLADIPSDESGAFDTLNEEFEQADNDASDSIIIRNNDNLEKGMVLMAEALKQYEEGKFELAEHNREQANVFFDKAKSELATEDGAEKAMYGENRNFGIIYNIIEENANYLYTTQEGREKLAKILKEIKTNPVLLHEFKVYDALTKPVNVTNVENYVNEVASVTKRFGQEKLVEENSKLIKFLKKLNINECIDIPDSKIDLYESIEYMLINKPSISNVKEYAEIKSMLRENIEKNNRQSKNRVDVDQIRDNGVDELTEKYDAQFNDDEKQLIEDVASSPKKAERHFNEIKDSLMNQLQDKINESVGSDKEGWEHILKTVESKSFNNDTVLNTISDMIALKETIN